jgi:Undecaprenyl-phosphate galactose phosphotransferase WbaP
VGTPEHMISSKEYQYPTLVAEVDSRARRAAISNTRETLRLYFRWWLPVARVAVLLATDLCALAVGTALAYTFWAYGILHQPVDLYKALFAFVLMVPIGYAVAGLYPGFGLGATEAFRRLCLSNTCAFLVIMDLVFLMKLPDSYSRMTLAMAFAASLITVPTGRLILAGLSEHWSWWRKPAILVGSDSWVQATTRTLNRRRALGFRAIGSISDGLANRENWTNGSAIPGTTTIMMRLAEQGKCAVIVQQGSGQGVPESLVQRFRHVMVLMEDFEGLPLENSRLLNFGSLMGLEFTNRLTVRRNRILKRALDMVLGGLLSVIAAPIILIAAILVMIFDGFPPFYCQRREGRGGRIIKVWKLRTMCRDSERRLEEALAADPELRKEWEEHCKLARDPRIIPGLGAILRRFSVDELPQFWSVAKGEMSLVGPRPYPEYHLQRYSEEYRVLRRQVRPGLTGWTQVMLRSDADLDQQKRFDTYYICNWSVWLDLYILSRTFWTVVTSRGAY